MRIRTEDIEATPEQSQAQDETIVQLIHRFVEGRLPPEQHREIEARIEHDSTWRTLHHVYVTEPELPAASAEEERESDRWARELIELHLSELGSASALDAEPTAAANVVSLTHAAAPGARNPLGQLLLRHGVRPLSPGTSQSVGTPAAASEWAAAAASSEESAGGGETVRVTLLETDGTERELVARLMPGWSWRNELIDLWLELPLEAASCEASVAVALDDAQGGLEWRSLGSEELRVDEAGLLQVVTSWSSELTLPDFDPQRLHVFVVQT